MHSAALWEQLAAAAEWEREGAAAAAAAEAPHAITNLVWMWHDPGCDRPAGSI